jgi:hypothetical protein
LSSGPRERETRSAAEPGSVHTRIVEGEARVRVLYHQPDGGKRGFDGAVARIVGSGDQEAGLLCGGREVLYGRIPACTRVEAVEDWPLPVRTVTGGHKECVALSWRAGHFDRLDLLRPKRSRR